MRHAILEVAIEGSAEKKSNTGPFSVFNVTWLT
jgi:hypothetical protein